MTCLRKAIPEWDQRIEKERMKQAVKEAPVLAEHRRPTKEEQVKGSDRTFKRGETATYLTARLKRDAPQIIHGLLPLTKIK